MLLNSMYVCKLVREFGSPAATKNMIVQLKSLNYMYNIIVQK